MEKSKKNILIIVFVILVIFVSSILISEKVRRSQEGSEISQGQGEETEKENSSSQEEYPNNLLQGVVKAANIENETLILEAETGLIKTSQQDKMEKSIKATKSTIYEIYHIDTGKTDNCQFSEIVVDDNIVVWTLESTYEEINNLGEFTAVKITKMITEIKIPDK